MAKFLLDENLSPKLARHLESTHGLDVVSILAMGQASIDDVRVRALARRLDRVIVTLDRDFVDATTYKFRTPPGIIWLNPSPEYKSLAGYKQLLDRFLWEDAKLFELDTSIVEVSPLASRLIYTSR